MYNSLTYNALEMTTVLKTLMKIDGLSDNGDTHVQKHNTRDIQSLIKKITQFFVRSLRSRFFASFQHL